MGQDEITLIGEGEIYLSVIVPSFNEEARLPELLDEISSYLTEQAYFSEILVVDDGSTDATAAIAQNVQTGSTPLKLLQYADGLNHGKGAAVRLGMLAAKGKYRLFTDCDNSTSIDQVDGFLCQARSGYDIVIGSRRAAGADIRVAQAWHRVVAGIVGNLLIRILLLPRFADTQAGFKLFTDHCAEAVFSRLTIERWAFDVEVLVIAQELGFRVHEAPILWINSADSKVRLRDYVQVLRDIWRIRSGVRSGLYS